jgi:hypothetical protein
MTKEFNAWKKWLELDNLHLMPTPIEMSPF